MFTISGRLPKEMPQIVGQHLVVDLQEDPDWVWELKCVLRPRIESKHAFDFRIFDPAEAASKGVNVKDYHSLDEHPEMILFEGWFDKQLMKVHLQEKPVPTPRAA